MATTIIYKVPTYLKQMSDRIIQLILKVAKDLGYCYPGNKVMIFTIENEGKAGMEQVNFKMIEIEEE